MQNRRIIVLLAVIMMGVSGCMQNNGNAEQGRQQAEQIKIEIEEYLEEKYDEKFSVLSLQGQGLLEKQEVCRAIVRGGNSETDSFVVKRNQSTPFKSVMLEDGYYGILIRPQMEQMVYELPAMTDVNCKVYIRRFLFPGFDQKFTKKNSLKEAKEAGIILDADYYIFTEEAGREQEEFYEMAEQLFEQMSELGQPGLVRVCGLNRSAFEKIDRKNCDVYLPDYYHADGIECLMLVREVVK